MAKRSDESLWKILEVSQCPKACQPELRALVQEGHSLRGLIVRLDEVKKRIAQIVIEEHGLINDDGKYGVRDGPNVVLVRQQDGKETLNRELLIEAGVSPAQIKAGMKRGAGFNVVEFERMSAED